MVAPAYILAQGVGIIGAGAHDTVATKATELTSIAHEKRQLFHRSNNDVTPPASGMVHIYLRRGSDLYVLTASEEELGEGDHPASIVFYSAHELISAIREVEE